MDMHNQTQHTRREVLRAALATSVGRQAEAVLANIEAAFQCKEEAGTAG